MSSKAPLHSPLPSTSLLVDGQPSTTSDQGFSKPAKYNLRHPRVRALIISYLKDWLLVIVVSALFFAFDLIEPYHRDFSLSDISIHYPYAVKERIDTGMLVVIALIVPGLIIIITAIVRKHPHDAHNGLLGLLFALSLTIMITDVVKIATGRPRPDFLDRCQPAAGSVDPPLGVSNGTICTQTDHAIMKDGWKSFPSGHSSFSFAGMTFLALWLSGKLHIFDGKGQVYKGFLCVSPLLASSLVAISRTMDYRHHWSDVLTGALVGLGFALFSYYQYYPPLSSPRSDRPLAPRIPKDIGTDDGLKIGDVRQVLTTDFVEDEPVLEEVAVQNSGENSIRRS